MERVCVALEPGCRSGSSLYIYRVYLLTFTYLLTLTYVDTVKTRGLPRDGAEPGLSVDQGGAFMIYYALGKSD